MKLTCLVDNAVQARSTLWGEHGLAFLIESQGKRVLFDTGASGTVLLHNLLEMDIPPGSLDALALSHAHYDHTGGLEVLLKLRPGLALYAHPDLLRERFSRRGTEAKSVGLRLTEEALRRRAELRLCPEPQEIVPGVWTTGEIGDRTEPEGRSPHHWIRDGEVWAPDPYRDDLALALDSPAGLVLVCGCCHAGLLNTLAQVRQTFGRDPTAIVGGAHLINSDPAHLRRLIEVLRRLGPPSLFLNHCTGQAAYVALAHAFGEQVHPCPAGTVLPFTESLGGGTKPAEVVAVCRSERRTDPKYDVGEGEFRAGWGLVGDAHAGPPQPGRWQVSLLAWESVERLNREKGLDAQPGSFAENLTTRGLDTAALAVGDRLLIGDQVVLEVEQRGKPPTLAHTYQYHGYSLLPTEGIFCRVITGGLVRRGDPIHRIPHEAS